MVDTPPSRIAAAANFMPRPRAPLLAAFGSFPFRSSLFMSVPSSNDAPEADVGGRRVDGLGMPRRRPIATAVVRRAQMRAALQYPARDPDLRLARVVAQGLWRAAR